MLRPLLAGAAWALLTASCGVEREAVSAGATAGSVAGATVAAASPADAPAGRPACPATGLWSRCALVERLERSGLVPRVDSLRVDAELQAAERFMVRLGRAELEVYLYPDAGARERAAAKLDRARYLDYTAPVTMDQRPTLIEAGNALVILHSRNDHQRERVGDAITAGAPARVP